MKKIASVLLILGAMSAEAQTSPTSVAGSATVASTDTTVSAIFADFYKASGGKTKWDSVKTYTLTRSFVANAPTDYDMEVNVNVADSHISRRKSIMKRDFYYVSTPSAGYVRIPMGSMDRNVRYMVKDLSAKEVEEMQQEVKDGLLAFVNFEEKGFTASYEGEEAINSKPARKVKLTRDDLSITYFFDKATDLIVREVYTTPTLTETWEHTKYDTTKTGLKYASASTYINTKDKRRTNVTTKLVVDEQLNPAAFVR